jgi:hypothetical protein
LDSWVLQQDGKDFEKANPNVGLGVELGVRSDLLLRYEITAHSYSKEEKRHNFAVVLVFQSQAGTEIKKSHTGAWQVW